MALDPLGEFGWVVIAIWTVAIFRLRRKHKSTVMDLALTALLAALIGPTLGRMLAEGDASTYIIDIVAFTWRFTALVAGLMALWESR